MQQTLRMLKDNIDKIIQEHPKWIDLPLAFSTDDEGSNYEMVYNEICAAQVHDLTEINNLELVGYKGDPTIDDRDINCIIVN